MNVIDFFMNMARSAEQKVGGLAQAQAANLERRKALDDLDARIGQLVADGRIDPAEAEEIRSQLRRAGADTATIEALFRELDSVDGDKGDLESKLEQAVRRQRGVAEDDQVDSALALNFAIDDYRNGIETASSLLKNKHDAEMAVIRNLI